ncbi:MAG: DUF1292 domain-containing protein [Oscillospiraceae bacterium]
MLTSDEANNRNLNTTRWIMRVVDTSADPVSGSRLEDDGKFVVLRSMEDNGEEILVTIDDDEEYEKIGNMFIQRAEEMMAMMDGDDDAFDADLEDDE